MSPTRWRCVYGLLTRVWVPGGNTPKDFGPPGAGDEVGGLCETKSSKEPKRGGVVCWAGIGRRQRLWGPRTRNEGRGLRRSGGCREVGEGQRGG